MRFIVCKDYKEMSRCGAEIIKAVVLLKPNACLGLATGSTPEGLYAELVNFHNEGLDFSAVRSVNLDEYKGLTRDNDQSYYYFMNKHLFSKVNIKKENTHLPNGENPNSEEECKLYDKCIENMGGVDIQLLGIGLNGHIGFNEPADCFKRDTHCVTLSESTIKANSRFFEKYEDVPTQAYTMGIGTIMKAKKILLVANGAAKADIIKESFFGPITPQVQASVLQLHPDVTVILDKESASKL